MCLSVLICIPKSDAVSSIFKKLTSTPCSNFRHNSMWSLKVENKMLLQVRKHGQQLFIANYRTQNEGRCFKSFICFQKVNYFPLCSKDSHWPSVITSRGCRHSWNHFKSNLHHPVLCLFPNCFPRWSDNLKIKQRLEKRTVGGKKIGEAFVFVISGYLWVPAVQAPAYLCVCSARKAPMVPIVTGCVLETEACFVAFSHPPLCVGIKQVVVAEFIHAVVMSNVPHNDKTTVSDTERK